MQCSNCGEKIVGKPVKQTGEFYCSLECANVAAGIDPAEEEEDYFEEDEIEGLFDEDE